MKKILIALLLLLAVMPVFADNIDEPAAVTVSATSTPVYAANPKIGSIIISNTGATSCFLSCKATAINGRGIVLAAGTSRTFDKNDPRLGPFSAITASGTTTVTVSARIGE